MTKIPDKSPDYKNEVPNNTSINQESSIFGPIVKTINKKNALNAAKVAGLALIYPFGLAAYSLYKMSEIAGRIFTKKNNENSETKDVGEKILKTENLNQEKTSETKLKPPVESRNEEKKEAMKAAKMIYEKRDELWDDNAENPHEDMFFNIEIQLRDTRLSIEELLKDREARLVLFASQRLRETIVKYAQAMLSNDAPIDDSYKAHLNDILKEHLLAVAKEIYKFREESYREFIETFEGPFDIESFETEFLNFLIQAFEDEFRTTKELFSSDEVLNIINNITNYARERFISDFQSSESEEEKISEPLSAELPPSLSEAEEAKEMGRLHVRHDVDVLAELGFNKEDKEIHEKGNEIKREIFKWLRKNHPDKNPSTDADIVKLRPAVNQVLKIIGDNQLAQYLESYRTAKAEGSHNIKLGLQKLLDSAPIIPARQDPPPKYNAWAETKSLVEKSAKNFAAIQNIVKEMESQLQSHPLYNQLYKEKLKIIMNNIEFGKIAAEEWVQQLNNVNPPSGYVDIFSSDKFKRFHFIITTFATREYEDLKAVHNLLSKEQKEDLKEKLANPESELTEEQKTALKQQVDPENNFIELLQNPTKFEDLAQKMRDDKRLNEDEKSKMYDFRKVIKKNTIFVNEQKALKEEFIPIINFIHFLEMNKTFQNSKDKSFLQNIKNMGLRFFKEAQALQENAIANYDQGTTATKMNPETITKYRKMSIELLWRLKESEKIEKKEISVKSFRKSVKMRLNPKSAALFESTRLKIQPTINLRNLTSTELRDKINFNNNLKKIKDNLSPVDELSNFLETNTSFYKDEETQESRETIRALIENKKEFEDELGEISDKRKDMTTYKDSDLDQLNDLLIEYKMNAVKLSRLIEEGKIKVPEDATNETRGKFEELKSKFNKIY